MSKTDEIRDKNGRIAIRRRIKKAADESDSITESEVRSHVAVVTDTDPSLVADEIEVLKKYGEIYMVPTDDGDPEVRRP